jgi:hypothetical protein
MRHPMRMTRPVRSQRGTPATRGREQAIYGRPLEGDVDEGLGCSSLGVELSGG